MKCGKERPELTGPGGTAAGGPSAPPPPFQPPPPAGPPMPGYAPPPPPAHLPQAPYGQQPSPGALFARRVFTGDWAGSAQAALWPVAVLVIVAMVFSARSGSGEFGSWSTRFQTALAVLLQGLGATADIERDNGAGISVSLWVLSMTALWIAATIIGARLLRRRSHPAGSAGDGLAAAIRIALLAAFAVLALGLYGQPDFEGVSVSTTPVLAALLAFGLTAVLSAAVLCREALARRASAGALMAMRAWGTALRALALSVALWALIDFVIILWHQDQLDDGWDIPYLLVALGNFAMLSFGVSWGADAEYSGGGDTGYGDLDSIGPGRHWHGGAGLSQVGDQWGGWAQTGVVAAGVLCALTLTLLVVRRATAGRQEAVLSGVFFLAAVWLLSLVSGFSAKATANRPRAYGPRAGSTEFGINAGEFLLFGLAWTVGAVLLAMLIQSSRGAGGVRPGPYGPPPHPPMPGYAPPPPPGRLPTVIDRGASSGPPWSTAHRRGRALRWAAVGAAAFVVGGAVAGGVLLLKDDGKGERAKPKPPVVALPGGQPSAGASPLAGASPSVSESPSASPSPADTPTPGAQATRPQGDPPAGYERVTDPQGFSLAVVKGWTREEKGSGQTDYHGPTGPEHLRVGILKDAKQSVYDHFLEMEKVVARQEGYRRVQLTRNTFQGRPGALWEWTWTDHGRTMRANDQAYVDDSGTEYAILFQGRDFPSATRDRTFQAALDFWSAGPPSR